MAKIIDTLPGRAGRRPVHPWDEYFDGQARELSAPEDFTCKPASFRSAAQQRAAAYGGKLETRLVDNKVYLRFTREGA